MPIVIVTVITIIEGIITEGTIHTEEDIGIKIKKVSQDTFFIYL